MRNHKEDDLQIACVYWFKMQHPNIVILSVPNGGSRNPIEAAKLKRTGTLAGVADLFVMRSKKEWIGSGATGYTTIWHGCWIELKAGKNTLTEHQSDFAVRAMAANYQYHVCRSLDEFIKVVNDYLK